jgi:acetyltransferase EpsM
MQLFIIGTGDHSEVLYSTAKLLYEPDSIFFVSAVPDPILRRAVHQTRYRGTLESLVFDRENDRFIIGIGDNPTRHKIVQQYPDLPFVTLVHPHAIVEDSVMVGHGTFIACHAVVNVGSRIGDHCIINTRTSVDHHCSVDDFAHLAPNTTLCGNVTIGKGVFLGATTTVVPNIQITTPFAFIKATSLVK